MFTTDELANIAELCTRNGQHELAAKATALRNGQLTLFVWDTGEATMPILATDKDHAFRLALGCRLGEDHSPENVLRESRAIRSRDLLLGVDCAPCDAAPYQGEIPEE